MIVLSLNCRGSASIPKKLAVRRLVEEWFPNVMFLQESMGDGHIIAAELESVLKGWNFVSVDAKGKSSGFLLGWRTHNF